MTHTINQKQWGGTVLVDNNEGLHKENFRDVHSTHVTM